MEATTTGTPHFQPQVGILEVVNYELWFSTGTGCNVAYLPLHCSHGALHVSMRHSWCDLPSVSHILQRNSSASCLARGPLSLGKSPARPTRPTCNVTPRATSSACEWPSYQYMIDLASLRFIITTWMVARLLAKQWQRLVARFLLHDVHCNIVYSAHRTGSTNFARSCRPYHMSSMHSLTISRQVPGLSAVRCCARRQCSACD